MRYKILAGVLLVAVVGAFGLWLGQQDLSPHLSLPGRTGCDVSSDGEVSLDNAQMANAATITAVGVRRGLPQRATVVALATALQESKLRNLAGGDRDSVGLFQQRPSQGWGSPEELRNPRHAAGLFYDHLMNIDGWEDMRVTDAAQAVQQSAYPEAYQKWADEAAVLGRAFVGQTPNAVACNVPSSANPGDSANLYRMLELDWGGLVADTSASGVGIPVEDSQEGWRYAHWLVAYAGDHGVKRIRFAGQEWTAAKGTWAAAKGGAAGTNALRVDAEVSS